MTDKKPKWFENFEDSLNKRLDKQDEFNKNIFNEVKSIKLEVKQIKVKVEEMANTPTMRRELSKS